CDDMYIDGTSKPKDVQCGSYSHAEKIHAMACYGFKKILQTGEVPWHQLEGSNRPTGHWVGNPAISEIVLTYMVSLHRRKVQQGETPQSSRAIRPEDLLKLWQENTKPNNFQPGFLPNGPGSWGGGITRRALHAIYMIAFCCLLHFDEVLKIQAHDIAYLDATTISITLPFCKTSQYGHITLSEIEPFVLKEMPSTMAHLCPVQALAEWLAEAHIKTGYLFWKIGAHDCVITTNEPMVCPALQTSDAFLDLFRHNLLDIGLDPYVYGTHSFHHGGCQWLSVHLRWGLHQICEWGGWSAEFTHLTIIKYLISWNDTPMLHRDQFFDFSRPPTVKCHSCG
ncbi:hypothetical protein EDD18DRAFT_1076755, partial [Armillaria luteobubalina]